MTAEAQPPIDPALLGARVQEVRQPDEERLYLQTHRAGQGAAWWLFCLHPETGRLGRVTRPPPKAGAAPHFARWLRARLPGAHVRGLAWPHPQIVELALAHGDEALYLVLELNRRESNLLLLDGQRCLLIAMRHPAQAGRHLGPGQPYAPPRLFAYPGPGPLDERYPAPDARAAAELEARWRAREERQAFERQRTAALGAARRELKKHRRRLEHLEADQAAAAEAERWRRQGELLQIHRQALRPGLAELEVPDVFEPGQPTVTIRLDPQAEPAVNVERLFKRYRKLRDAAGHVAQRLAETRAATDDWEALLQGLEAAGSLADLQALPERLPPGAAREAVRLLAPRARRPQAEAGRSGVLERISADGYTVLVGRSRTDNARVTFRLANGRDWWFHAQGIPGSHVVVRNPGGGPLPPATLHEAAWLAAYYSQARQAGKVDVDYTQRKHVRKIKGAEPGEVIYAQNRTLLVDVGDETLRQVLERTEP